MRVPIDTNIKQLFLSKNVEIIFQRFLFQHNLNLYSSYRVSLIDANFVIIAVK